MIKLEDFFLDKYPELKDIIGTQDVKSVKELLKIIRKSPIRIPYQRKSFIIEGILEDLGRFNATKEYGDSSLDYVDTLNNGRVLLLSSPTKDITTRYRGLNNLSISDIRKFLTTINMDGSNYLLERVRKVGENSLPKIIEAVNMYHDQVVRVSETTPQRDVNLFMLDKEKKEEIVKELYSKLIWYLIQNSKELTWGKMSDAQKELYYSSAVNNKQIDRLIKNRMIDIFANYTTLGELKEIEADCQVLKRFIKR